MAIVTRSRNRSSRARRTARRSGRSSDARHSMATVRTVTNRRASARTVAVAAVVVTTAAPAARRVAEAHARQRPGAAPTAAPPGRGRSTIAGARNSARNCARDPRWALGSSGSCTTTPPALAAMQIA